MEILLFSIVVAPVLVAVYMAVAYVSLITFEDTLEDKF
jgi:hypothetical protein